MYNSPFNKGANGYSSAPQTNSQITASDVEFMAFERFFAENKTPLSEEETNFLNSNMFLTASKRQTVQSEAVIYEFVRNIPLKEQKKRYGSSDKFKEKTLMLLESRGVSISAKSFYRRFSAYKKDGVKALIHGLLGNNNARKIGTEQHNFIHKYYSDSRKFNISWIQRKFNEEFDISISVSAISKYIKRNGFKYDTDLARHGSKFWKDNYGNTFKLKKASKRDSLWVVDGTKMNLYYKDENGKIKADLQVTVIIDEFSRNVVGWHVSHTETAEATFIAFKRALNYSGNKPYQFLYDNQSGIKSKRFQAVLDRLTHVHMPTAPYSPQAKSIELFFKHFQESDMRAKWNFTGQNITAKSQNSRANMDVILANKDKLPTKEGAINQFSDMVNAWNTRVHEGYELSPQEMYNSSTNDGVEAVSLQEIVEGFWITKDKTIKYKKDGIKVNINKELLHYEVQDANGGFSLDFHRKNIDKSCFVKYDPENLESVWLYDESHRFLAEAKTKNTFPRAIQDQIGFDLSLMRGEIEKRKLEHGRMVAQADDNRFIEDLNSSGLSTKEQQSQFVGTSISDSYYDDM